MTAKELLAGRPAIGDADEKAVVVWDLKSRRQLIALTGRTPPRDFAI